MTIEVREGSPSSGSRIVFAGLPDDTVILLVHRNNEFFMPNGRNVIEKGDHLVVLTSRTSVDGVRVRLSGEDLTE